MQLASQVDKLSFFKDEDEPELKERTNSCEDVHQSSQYEPLDSGERAGVQAVETNSSKSAENSPYLIPTVVEDERCRSTLAKADKIQQQEEAPASGTSKLLQIIEPSRVQAEEEIGRLTQDELRLFLKLCKDPSVAQQFGTTASAGDTMTSSTVTSSETSSQDNSYMPAPQATTVSVASPANAHEYPREYLTAAQDSSVTDYSSTPGGDASNGFSSGLFIASGSEKNSRGRQCGDEVKAVSTFVAEAGVSCPFADAAKKAPEVVSATIVGAN